MRRTCLGLWGRFGLKARKEVQRREVSEQFIGFEEDRRGKMKKERTHKVEVASVIERFDFS